MVVLGYSVERFRSAFSQSKMPHLHQLDAYHIAKDLNRTFGYKRSKLKDQLKDAIKSHDYETFTLILDTYESTLDNEKEIEKVNKFRIYLLNHWQYVKD